MKLNIFSKKLYDLIDNSTLDEIDIRKRWNDLKNEVNETIVHPRDVSKIIEILKKIPKKKEEIKILDFGCGGCISIFYLAALGYSNVWGVDMDISKEKFYLFLKKISLIESNSEYRILNYQKLPLNFNNDEFDFIFSQQVFEHVKYQDFFPIVNEISRLLKTGAITYHQIPHKLGPFDYHTKTWFLHWFPKRVTVFLLKLLNKNSLFFKEHLWFKFPWEYMREFEQVIGSTQNFSSDRISEFSDTFAEKETGETYNEFKGINRFLRILFANLSKIKIIRPIVKIFSYFLMLEIVSKKK